MRRILVALLLFAATIVPLASAQKAQADTQNFTIQSFDADYYLSRNEHQAGELRVEETIVAEFPNYDQNHGILRAIPEKYQGHSVKLDVQSVTNESGAAYQYSTYKENDNLVIKIGDPNIYARGLTTYKISYTLRNIINFPDDATGNELFWNINGTQWSQPIRSITGRVFVPAGLASSLTGQQKCYTGTYGSTDSNCVITAHQEDGQSITTVTATNVAPGENASFVIGFNDQTFQQGPEVAAEKRNFLILLVASIFFMLILPIITFISLYRKWRTEGRDPKGRGVIVPEYVSPKGLNVISSAYILDQATKPGALSAGIIEAAVQGYIKIHEVKTKKLIGSSTDYELEIIKSPSTLATEQQDLLTQLFNNNVTVGQTISIKSQSNKLHSAVTKIDAHLAQALTTAGYFKSNPAKARSRFIGRAVGFFIAGIILLIILPILFPIEIGLILSGVIALIFSIIMPARTEQGVATKEYLLGLKEYIALAEKDRIAYLQSPQGAEKRHIDPNNPKQQIKLFEDLLPYAILFGLEKDWAKQFNNLYTQPPTWYDGNINTFNAVYLASALGSMNSATNSAFTAPSSSSSSGFGGGGFSGGGGGGGGGGGW